MKKGLFFIAVIALFYWGYYYFKNKVPVKPEPLITGDELRAPIRKAEDAVHKANLNILKTSIEIFRQHERRYPVSLRELVEKKYLSRIPDPGEKDWEYNPSDGSVN
jgi:hypothetical protein